MIILKSQKTLLMAKKLMAPIMSMKSSRLRTLQDSLISLTISKSKSTLQTWKSPLVQVSNVVTSGQARFNKILPTAFLQLEVKMLSKCYIRKMEIRRKNKILQGCITKHMATLLRENRGTESITGHLIRHNTDSAMENRDFLTVLQCRSTMSVLRVVSQKQL